MLRKFTLVLLSSILFISCGTGTVIKDDKPAVTATSWQGKAKIVSIGKEGESSSREKNYLEVRFDFIPDDPAAPQKYIVPDEGDRNRVLYYDNRTDLHKNWILKWGLKVGNEYRATRYENIKNSHGRRTEVVVILEPR